MLYYLECSSNDLTSLDVSSSPSQKYVYCYANRISELKLGRKEESILLNCGRNNLTELDISGLPLLNGISASFTARTIKDGNRSSGSCAGELPTKNTIKTPKKNLTANTLSFAAKSSRCLTFGDLLQKSF